jgi:hypothetical protein
MWLVRSTRWGRWAASKLIKESHSKSVFHLVLVVGYLKKLLDNARVVRFLSQNHPGVLSELQKLIEAKHTCKTALLPDALVPDWRSGASLRYESLLLVESFSWSDAEVIDAVNQPTIRRDASSS